VCVPSHLASDMSLPTTLNALCVCAYHSAFWHTHYHAAFVICQRYLDCCCLKSGSLGESTCPHLCLCCEAYCCIGLAISATRLHVMETYGIQPDPCDARIIRFNNCIQLLSCFCKLAAAISGSDAIESLAQILDLIAQLVFMSTSACMQTQTNYEVYVVRACYQTSCMLPDTTRHDKTRQAKTLHAKTRTCACTSSLARLVNYSSIRHVLIPTPALAQL
jgi:hypothetical protein